MYHDWPYLANNALNVDFQLVCIYHWFGVPPQKVAWPGPFLHMIGSIKPIRSSLKPLTTVDINVGTKKSQIIGSIFSFEKVWTNNIFGIQSTPDAKKFWSVFSILFVTPHAFRVILQPNFLPLKQNALVKNTLSFWAILYKYLYNR